MNAEFAYNKIFDLLENEDASINLLNPKAGIFFAPELYIVFQVGRLLKTNELKVFGETVEWLRETNLKNGGPSDLVFKNKDEDLYVFEFKIRSTINSYERDIEKLRKLTANPENKVKRRFLISLVDVFFDETKTDQRVKSLKQLKPFEMNFKTFVTKQDWYTSKEVSCLLGMWEI